MASVKPLLRRRRVWLGVPLVLIVLFGLWAGWRAYQVYGDLKAAEQAARAAMAAAEADDQPALEAAVADLQEHAAAADSRTGGPTWSVLTKLPVYGDDAEGVRALSQALHTLGEDGAEPMLDTFSTVRTLNQGGRVDLAAVRTMQQPVAAAHAAATEASATLHGVDSAGFIDTLKSRYIEFADIVYGLDQAMAAAQDASGVLPVALGGAGERTYLLVFLNNAEIRTSGGMPGAFAEVKARNGQLSLVRQGGPADLGEAPAQPVLPLSKAELSFYGEQLGIYFQDANFIQDMPRTAELMAARYQQYSGTTLDGVLTLDTVGMSYLLDGAGAVTTPDGVTLTSQNAVAELLNGTYLNVPDPTLQDARFAAVAQSTFDAVTTGVRDQFALVKGLGKAADEGRLLVHLFDDKQQQKLAGTRLAGELTSAPQGSPEVDLGFDDVTASKMSYYLRYQPQVRATSCAGDVQQLAGEVKVTSEVTPELAKTLPESITGGGEHGTEPGYQMTMLRIYGPAAGKVGQVQVDGEKVEVDRILLNGRPAAALPLLLAPGQTSTITWDMTSGSGQTGPIDLGVTPSVVPGDLNARLASACE